MNYTGPGYYAITDGRGFAVDVKWFNSRERAEVNTGGKCYYWGKSAPEYLQ